jgi:hypothetical protein
MTIAAARSSASWIQSISFASLLVCLNSTGRAPAASRHIASIWARLVEP